MRGLRSIGYWALVVGLWIVFGAIALLLFVAPYVLLGWKFLSPG